MIQILARMPSVAFANLSRIKEWCLVPFCRVSLHLIPVLFYCEALSTSLHYVHLNLDWFIIGESSSLLLLPPWACEGGAADRLYKFIWPNMEPVPPQWGMLQTLSLPLLLSCPRLWQRCPRGSFCFSASVVYTSPLMSRSVDALRSKVYLSSSSKPCSFMKYCKANGNRFEKNIFYSIFLWDENSA